MHFSLLDFNTKNYMVQLKYCYEKLSTISRLFTNWVKVQVNTPADCSTVGVCLPRSWLCWVLSTSVEWWGSPHCRASPCGPAAAGPGSPQAAPTGAGQTETGDQSTAENDIDLQRVSNRNTYVASPYSLTEMYAASIFWIQSLTVELYAGLMVMNAHHFQTNKCRLSYVKWWTKGGSIMHHLIMMNAMWLHFNQSTEHSIAGNVTITDVLVTKKSHNFVIRGDTLKKHGIRVWVKF